MGCSSSKMVGRTGSFRAHAYTQRRVGGAPKLEDLMGSNAGENSFLTLLFTANKVTTKLKAQQENERLGALLEKMNRSESKLPEDESQPAPHDVVNAWELMAGLDDDDRGSEVHECSKCPEEHHDGSRIACGPVSDDCRSAQMEEFPLDDFLSCSGDDEDSSDDHEESSLCAELDDAVHPAVTGDEFCRLKKPDNVSCTATLAGEELRASKIPSFRFRSAAGAGTGGEEEEPVSGYATPKFGRYEGLELDHGGDYFHDELVAHLEDAMKSCTAEEELILMTVMEEFLEQVQVAT